MIFSFGERSRWFFAEFIVIIDERGGTLQDEEREQRQKSVNVGLLLKSR